MIVAGRVSPKQTPNAEWPLVKSDQTLLSNIQKTRQEGLEPPTDGFGDRYSTN
jgi:hypothetical protein